LNGAKGAMPPEFALKKFQERPSGASGMQENLFAAGGWGSLQHSPRPTADGEGAGFPLSKGPSPLSDLWASGFGPSGIAPES